LILSSPNLDIICEISLFSKAGALVPSFAGGAAAFAGVDDGCEGVIELADLLF
jgi:hypothetical protein